MSNVSNSYIKIIKDDPVIIFTDYGSQRKIAKLFEINDPRYIISNINSKVFQSVSSTKGAIVLVCDYKALRRKNLIDLAIVDEDWYAEQGKGHFYNIAQYQVIGKGMKFLRPIISVDSIEESLLRAELDPQTNEWRLDISVPHLLRLKN